MYEVVNEQCACFTVLNKPNLNTDKEMQDGVVGVGWGRGYCKCNVEELEPKLLLMLKEKFAEFPANHAENLPREA